MFSFSLCFSLSIPFLSSTMASLSSSSAAAGSGLQAARRKQHRSPQRERASPRGREKGGEDEEESQERERNASNSWPRAGELVALAGRRGRAQLPDDQEERDAPLLRERMEFEERENNASDSAVSLLPFSRPFSFSLSLSPQKHAAAGAFTRFLSPPLQERSDSSFSSSPAFFSNTRGTVSWDHDMARFRSLSISLSLFLSSLSHTHVPCFSVS